MSSSAGPASPLSYLLTPQEARSIHKRALSLGLPLPTPTCSTSSPPPTSTAESAAADLPRITAETPILSLETWLTDDRLPKTVRTAVRAGLLAAAINSGVAGVTTAISRKSLSQALRRMLSRTSFRLFTALLAFSSLYRISLTALLILRQRFLANLSSLAPRSIHRSSASADVDERTTRARCFSRLVRFVRSDGTAPALAALAAAPALALLLPGSDDFPWTYLASYTTVHSLSSLYAEARAVDSRLVRWVPDWCDSALLYAIGNGQLLWSFVFERATFPKGYGRTIVGRSSAYIPPRPPAHNLPEGVTWPSSDVVVDHIAKLATPTATSSPFPPFTSPLLSSLTPSRHPTTRYKAINPILDYSPAHPEHANLMCAMLHPTEPSCRKTLLKHFRSEWPASARTAGVFTAVASVLLRRKKWLHDPETELFNIVVATLQAATIISGSIGSAWAMTCLLQGYLPRNVLPQKRFFLNGFFSGVWIYIVPKSRRQELGLYVARMSAVSTWRVLEKRGQVRRPAYGKQLLLALGLAMMAGMHEADVGSMSSMLKTASARLFGERIAVQARSQTDIRAARPRRTTKEE